MAELTFKVSEAHKAFSYSRALLVIEYPISAQQLEKVKLAINAQLDHEIHLAKETE
ncbi:MAG: hypothetical protein SOH95_00045 [Bifidobacterium crudilactis]|jgi:hypothetical protein